MMSVSRRDFNGQVLGFGLLGAGLGTRASTAAEPKVVVKERKTLTLDPSGGFIRFSPDGKWLASSADEGRAQLPLWDVTTGEPHKSLKVAAHWLAFSPDNMKLATTTAGYGNFRL